MPAVARAGDTVYSPDGSGPGCTNPMNTTVDEVNSRKVYANGILIVVLGNLIASHPKAGCDTDLSTLSSSSSKVFIGGLGIGRIGDVYGNNIITKGSPSVFAG